MAIAYASEARELVPPPPGGGLLREGDGDGDDPFYHDRFAIDTFATKLTAAAAMEWATGPALAGSSAC
eukprot:4957964-Heterocapsa_arctica.AAC.1